MFTKKQNILLIFQRFKSHKSSHWAVKEKQKYPTSRALENFDDFYGSVYGIRWKSMRIAMLCERKYMALVNVFGDIEKTKTMLEARGASCLTNFLDFNNINTTNETVEKLPNDVGEHLVAANKMIKSIKNLNHQQDSQNSIQADNKNYFERIVYPNNTGSLFEFIPAKKIKGKEDFIHESDHYRYYNDQTTEFPLNFVTEQAHAFPNSLQIYTYEMGNVSTYNAPRRDITGVFSHYLMDGASILPAIMLDVQPGNVVLDACAAPGGKSLLLLQTLYPDVLVCNDIQESRLNRLNRIMNDYLHDFKDKWLGNRVIIRQSNIIESTEYDTYDKILVDVPCTTDRIVLNSNDNNLFKPTRIKERLKLPETQAAILANCLRLLKPGGTLVYSTCSLSPVQNDGVVNMALSKVFKENGISVTIHDTSVVTELYKHLFKFENPKGLKYGQMIIPFLPANFGPMYFSKITRN